MSFQILLVEDTLDTQAVVKRALAPELQVSTASTLLEAKRATAERTFDLILLDVHLPDGETFNFCAALKEDPRCKQTPVIFLTAKDEVDDKLLGFAAGASDYVVKPFNPRELRARVSVHLKKEEQKRKEGRFLSFENLRLDRDLMRAYVGTPDAPDGKESVLDLSPMTFKLLLFFVQHQERIFTREQLIDALWGEKNDVIDRTVDAHLSKLRRKLQNTGVSIESVYGVGYRLVRL